MAAKTLRIKKHRDSDSPVYCRGIFSWLRHKSFWGGDAGIFIKIRDPALGGPPLRFASLDELSPAALDTAWRSTGTDVSRVDLVFVEAGQRPDGVFSATKVRLRSEVDENAIAIVPAAIGYDDGAFSNVPPSNDEKHAKMTRERRKRKRKMGSLGDQDESRGFAAGSVSASLETQGVEQQLGRPHHKASVDGVDIRYHISTKNPDHVWAAKSDAPENHDVDDVWRRFHRKAAVFQNKNLDEKATYFKELKGKVASAIDAQDSHLLNRLILRICVLLSRPRMGKPNRDSCASQQTDTQNFHRALQMRIRKLLRTALAALSGEYIFWSPVARASLQYVLLFISDFEVQRGVDVARAADGESWQCIKLTAAAVLSQSATEQIDATATGFGKKQLRGAIRGNAMRGQYEPNAHVKSCPTVVHDSRHRKVLACNMCGWQLISSWFFMHPSTDERYVLAPNAGHSACRLGKRRAYYSAVDGSGIKLDKLNLVDFCTHNKTRENCWACCSNANRFCEHKVLRYNCRRCKRKQQD